MHYSKNIPFCFLIIISLFAGSVSAQTDTSTLRKRINTAKEDKAKVDLYRNATEYYRVLNPDTAYKMAEEGMKLSEKLNYLAGEAYLSGQLGAMDRTNGRLSLARVRYQNSIEFYERMSGAQFDRSIALLKLELGIVDGMQGKFDAATRNFLSALKTFDATSDTEGKVKTYIKLGLVNQNFDDLKKANYYFTTAVGLSKQIRDTADLVYLYNNLVINEGRLEHFDTAMRYYEQGIAYCTDQRYTDVKISLLLNAGIVLKEQNNERKALEYFNEAVRITRENNLRAKLPNLLLNIAMLGDVTPHATKIPLLKEALGLAIETEQQEIVANIYEMLAEVNLEEGHYKEAYLYKDSCNKINNEMFSVQKNTEIANLQALYDLDKSHNKVAQLEQENKSRNFQRNVFIVVAIIVLVVLVLLFMAYRKTILLNKELELGKERLAESNRVKDKIFSVIGHDLRTPIHTIIGMLKILDTENHGMTNEEEARVFKTLKEHSEASLETLNKLLLWGSRQIKGVSVEPEHINVVATLESNTRLLHENAVEKQIEIVNRVPANTTVYADASHFDFIVRNLLSNALKFSRNNSEVEVGIRDQQDDRFVCFYVKDSGVGIKPVLMENIFDLNSSSSLGTKNEKGTGLGLVLCKDFVALNGGRIWVESEEGKGATFFFLMKKERV